MMSRAVFKVVRCAAGVTEVYEVRMAVRDVLRYRVVECASGWALVDAQTGETVETLAYRPCALGKAIELVMR